MDGVLQPTVSTKFSVMVLIMIRPVRMFIGTMNQCQAETNHCAGFSFYWGSPRVETGERICLHLCDIYVCREIVNVRLSLDINESHQFL